MDTSNYILYFCSSSVFGGAERFVETCLEEHRKKGQKTQVYFLNSGYFSKRLIDAGFDVIISNTKVKLSNPFSWIRFQFEFYKFLRKSSITHVHATMAYSQIFSSVATHLAGRKLIWFQHGPIGGIIDKTANILPCDHIIFNSNYTKSEHLLKAGKIRCSSSILTLAVSPKFDELESKNIRDEYEGELFVLIGRVCRWKGYENAIKSFSDYEEQFSLLLIGAPSTDDDYLYLSELKELVKNLNLSTKVHFLGFKENVYDYVHASDALIHSSVIPEPFGLVVAEAKSLGIYVYATKIGGIIDQLNDICCGSMYSTENPVPDLLRLLREKKHQKNIINNSELGEVDVMISNLNNIYSKDNLS